MSLAPQDFQALQESVLTLRQQLHALEAQVGVADGAGAPATWYVHPDVHFKEMYLNCATVWLLCAAALVCFMQAGFALLEAGTCRAKNVLSVLVKNEVDFLCASVAWFVVGWGFAFGDASTTGGVVGISEFFGGGVWDGAEVSDKAIRFHFQQMFCAVSATIVSGGIAERAHLRGYVVYSIVMTAFIYPVVACWCWNRHGWLALLGFTDFAGAGAVHLTGGVGALVGAWAVGPRAGRFGTAGTSKDCHEFAPHNVPFVALGTAILQFGWYGFTTGSTMSMGIAAESRTAALAAINTTMAAAAGGIAAAAVCLLRRRRWDVPYVCNGVLAGCVSITAGCAYMSPAAAFAAGAFGGVGFGFVHTAMHRLRIDDPIGAFPVHGFCGFWGLLAASVFNRREGVLGAPVHDTQLWVQPPVHDTQLWVQLVGGLSICAFSGLTSLFVFLAIRRLGMLSSSREDQRRGLDCEFSSAAYNSGEVSRYRVFLSHAKSTHGATARWLQLELAHYARGKSSIFLDSDNLVNLNHLLTTVRDRVDTMVVLATEDVWWRPWCAGEIVTACSADVPIVLVMMGAAGQPLRLDFGEISGRVRHMIPPKAMDILAPFGIGYGDIELAYSRLAAVPQVQFGLLGFRGVRDAIAGVAHHAGLRRRRLPVPRPTPCWFRPDARAGQGQPLARGWGRKVSPNCVVLGDRDDQEAMAAMHICERALMQASDHDYSFRVATCTEMSAARILSLVGGGATIVIVLSKGVLECPLVQRACLARARMLWPDGFARSHDAGHSSVAVTIEADHLGFEFPCAAFYEKLQAGQGQRLGQGASDDQVVGSTSLGSEGDAQAATDRTLLAAFFRLLFQQIALPMSTHGSWKAIQQQIFLVYQRAKQIPRVLSDAVQPVSSTRASKSAAVLSKKTLKAMLQVSKLSSASTQSGMALQASPPSPIAQRTYSDISYVSGADADEEEVTAPDDDEVMCL